VWCVAAWCVACWSRRCVWMCVDVGLMCGDYVTRRTEVREHTGRLTMSSSSADPR